MGRVHSNFNPTAAGGVMPNAHPNVQTYPWVPIQNNVRPSPVATARGPKQVAGGATQRVQPIERGKTWRTIGLGASSPARNSGGCPGSCGGGCAGCGGKDDGGIGHAPGDRG